MHIGLRCRKSRHRNELGFIVGKVNLGVALLIHLIRVPFRRSRGVLEWTNAVRAEGLGPTALESWTGEEGISGLAVGSARKSAMSGLFSSRNSEYW